MNSSTGLTWPKGSWEEPTRRTWLEGGIFIPGGGRHHHRGGGYAKDAETYLEAVPAGWTVIRLTRAQLELGFIGRIVAWLNRAEDS
jgi:hypothetical protein